MAFIHNISQVLLSLYKYYLKSARQFFGGKRLVRISQEINLTRIIISWSNNIR